MILSITHPAEANIKIKPGDLIDFSTALYEIKSTTDHIQPCAKKLGITPSKIFHYLKKFVGEDVSKGDIIAIKKGLLTTVKIKSDYDGKIKEIDHHQGNIIISIKDKKNTVNSPVKGEVTEIKNKQIFVKVKDGHEYNLKNATLTFGGKTVFLKQENIMFTSCDVENKIAISESVSSYIQSKLETLGAAGYVTLLKLIDDTDLPNAQIKTLQEFAKITKHQSPYCYVDSKLSKIIFYG